MLIGGNNLGTPFDSTDAAFITAYGFDANNSGVLLSDSGNNAVSTLRWIERNANVGGLRPCVKIKDGIHFNESTLTIK